MGILCTTCVPNSAHYTGKWRGLAWSTPVVASFPGHRPVFHCFLFACGRAWDEQVLFRLHRVKLITDHSEEVDVTGYHTVGMLFS